MNDIFADPYEAKLQERISLVEVSRPETKLVVPDLLNVEGKLASWAGLPAEMGGILTFEPVTLTLPNTHEEYRDVWIEIRRRPDRSVVSVIEILSFTNKAGEGHEDYLNKRASLIRQRVNLIELDLLIQGRRLPMRQALPPGDYFAFIARADNRPACEVYSWSIRQPLPTIPVPLSSPDEDLPLALPAVFASAYDRGRYGRSLDYIRPLKLPIPAEDRSWAEALAHGATT